MTLSPSLARLFWMSPSLGRQGHGHPAALNVMGILLEIDT
jgi:hypothetical protein